MKAIIAPAALSLLLVAGAFAPAAAAGTTQTGPYTLECDGSGTSCQSLKTACTNGSATYTPLKGGGGKCEVGSAAGPSLAAKQQSMSRIKTRMQLAR